MANKKIERSKKSPRVPPEIVEALRREFENPSDPTVPDLPEFSAEDGGILIVKKRGGKRRG